MYIAALRDNGYNVVLLLHILSAMVAFAPAFAHPFLNEQTKTLDATNRQHVLGSLVQNGRRIYSPALIVTGVLGFALPAMSSDAYEFSQGWLIASIIVWIAMNGILHGVLFPAEKAMAGGDESVAPRVQIGGAMITLLLVVMLYLMLFKPGIG